MNESSSISSASSAQGIDLQSYVDVFRRRKLVFALAFGVVAGAGVANSLLTKPTFEARVFFALPEARPAPIAAGPAAGNLGLAKAEPGEFETPEAQVRSVQAGPSLVQALEASGIRPRPGVAPPSVEAKLITGTRWVSVAVTGGDAQDVAALANALPPAHIRAIHQERISELRERIGQLEVEEKKAADQLRAADLALLRYRSTHPLAETAAAREARAKEREELQSQLRAAQLSASSIRAQLAVLQQRLNAEPETVSQEISTPNPKVAPLESRLATLEAEKEELLRDFLEDSEEVKGVEAQIARVSEQLSGIPETVTHRTEVPNPNRVPIQARITDLEASLEASLAEARALRGATTPKGLVSTAETGRWELEEAKLVDDRQDAQAVHTLLGRSLKAAKAAAEEPPPPPAEFAKAGVPRAPVAPDRKKDIAFAIVLAFVMGAGIVFLLDFLDDRAHSPADVDRVSNLPALGHVPAMERNAALTLAGLPENSAVAECYRLVRSSISFASIDASVRRILITSATHDEGKTTTAVNLALAMAMDGKRVILVDADLRRPSINRVLEISSRSGLAQVLAGEVSLDEALYQYDTPNLRVLTAGGVPPQPAELLNSRLFSELLDELDNRADVVVFDSPPCTPVVDPLILASQVDGVVLVVRAGHTHLSEIKSAEELLGRARARILGLVYNRVQPNGSSYYKRHSYQYSGPAAGRANGRARPDERISLKSLGQTEYQREPAVTRGEGPLSD